MGREHNIKVVGGTCGKISGFSTGGVLRAFHAGCVVVPPSRGARKSDRERGRRATLATKTDRGDKGASAWRCERAWDVGQKWQQKWQQGCSGGGLTSKGVGGGHRPTSFQAFVSAEVTMAQSQNPLFAICNVMQISRERSAKDPRRARWRTPKALLTGIFHCGIPIYGLLPLCITGNTVTHTKARPWNTFRSFCAAWVLLCVPKKCQKGERGFVPAPAAMRWSHDNRSRQMAHRGFFIRFFLSRFHPWILARDSVFDFRQLTAWVMGSGLARTSEPSVENAPEKQSGSRHWRTMSDRHVVPEIHHLKVDIFCHPLAHPGRVERLIR